MDRPLDLGRVGPQPRREGGRGAEAEVVGDEHGVRVPAVVDRDGHLHAQAARRGPLELGGPAKVPDEGGDAAGKGDHGHLPEGEGVGRGRRVGGERGSLWLRLGSDDCGSIIPDSFINQLSCETNQTANTSTALGVRKFSWAGGNGRGWVRWDEGSL